MTKKLPEDLVVPKIHGRRIQTKRDFFRALNYIPHRGQRLIHNARQRFIIAICGRRWGKTLCAAREGLYQALKPGARILVTAPYQRLTDRIFSRIWFDALARLRLPVESRSRSDYIIRFPWDAVIEARTAENPDNLVGEGYDFIVFDESAKARAEVWEQYLAPSLMDKKGRALFISTPEGTNWLYELYLQVKRNRHLRKDWLAFVSPSRLNPHIPRTELMLMRRLLSDFSFAQEIEARFMRNLNLVYPQFSLERHVKPLAYEPRLPLYRALDFGYVNPFVCLTIQVTPNDEVRVLSEIYLRGHTLTELAKIMHESLAQYFVKFRSFWLNPNLGRDFISRRESQGFISSIHRREGFISNAHQNEGFIPRSPHSEGSKPSSERIRYNLFSVPPKIPTHPLTGAPRFPQSLSEFNEGIIYFCDPAGAGERATLHELGFITQARNAPISLGIELIRRALGHSNPLPNSARLPSKTAEAIRPATEQAPHLLIDPSCVNLIREFSSYRYPDPPGQAVTAGSALHHEHSTAEVEPPTASLTT